MVGAACPLILRWVHEKERIMNMTSAGKIVEVNADEQTAPLCPSCEKPLLEIRVHNTKEETNLLERDFGLAAITV